MGWPFDNSICSQQKNKCSMFHRTHKNWFLGHNLPRAWAPLAQDVMLALDTSFSLISFNRPASQMYCVPMGTNIRFTPVHVPIVRCSS